jgi:hypothetical protein
MKKYFVVAVLMALAVQPIFAQEASSVWGKWQYLLGEWQGAGSGQPGDGNGSFTLKPKLGGNILERKSKTEFAATATSPALIHEDVMIVYKSSDGTPGKAIYFDNEGHAIQYNITYADNKIILTSDVNSTMPRFRLSYEMLDKNLVNIRFEMAMPNAPEQFKLYLEGKSKKVKELSEMPK